MPATLCPAWSSAEWEYAAFGPQKLEYPWGNQWDPKKANGRNDDNRPDPSLPGKQAAARLLHPVRSLPDGRSWCGCHHMLGNVWEWTLDASTHDGKPSKIMRGGSWYDRVGPDRQVRHTRRPVSCRSDTGFRPVRARIE